MGTRYFFILIMVLGFFPAAGRSPAAELEIENIHAVTGNYLRNRQWNLIAVKVRNHSNRRIEAGVRVRLGTQNNLYLRSEKFPAHSLMTVNIPVFADFPSDALESAITSKRHEVKYADGVKYNLIRQTGTLPCSAAIVNITDGQEYGLRNDKLFALSAGSAITLEISGDDENSALPLVGRNAAGRSFVLGDYPPDDILYNRASIGRTSALVDENLPPDSFGMPVRSLIAFPETLSAEPHYWRNCKLVFSGILRHNARTTGLNPVQKNELLRWLHAGGHLVIMPVNDVESYRADPFWAELLPVILTGTRQANAADAAALEKLLPPPAPEAPAKKPAPAKNAPNKKNAKPVKKAPPQPVVIPLRNPFKEIAGAPLTGALPAPGGEIIAAANGEVLIAKRPVGAGCVYFAAFTGETLQRWSQSHQIFSNFFRNAPEQLDAPVTRELRDDMPQILQQMVGIPAPSKSHIAVMILCYLGLATVLLVGLRLRKRAELGWPILLVMAVGLFGVAYAMLHLARKQAGLQNAEIGIAVNAGDQCRQHSFIGMIAPENLKDNWQLQSPGIISCLPSQETGVVPAVYSHAQNIRPQIPNLNLHVEQFWANMVATTAPRKLEADISFNDKGLTGTIRNLSADVYRDGTLYFYRRAVPFAKLPPHSDLKITHNGELFRPDDGKSLSETAKITRRLIRTVVRPIERGAILQTLVAFAHNETPQVPFTVGKFANHPHPTQIAVLQPRLHIPPAGTRVFLPAGVAKLEFVDPGQAGAFFAATGSRKFTGMLSSTNKALPQIHSAGEAAPRNGNLPFPHWKQGRNATQFGLRFIPPLKIRPAAATLIFKGKLEGLRGEIAIVNAQGKETVLRRFPQGNSDFKLPVKDFPQIYAHCGKCPEFRWRTLRQIAPGKKSDSTHWEIEQFDIEITGTVAD